MKYIKLDWTKDWETKMILTMIVQAAPDGVRYEEIKKRCRILDVLEGVKEAQGEFSLEDADYDLLVTCAKNFKYGAATKQLLKILDSVMEAKNESYEASVSGSAPDANSISGGCVSGRTVAGGTGAGNGSLHPGPAQGKHLDSGIPTDQYVER